jgi:hypothetical protein
VRYFRISALLSVFESPKSDCYEGRASERIKFSVACEEGQRSTPGALANLSLTLSIINPLGNLGDSGNFPPTPTGFN